MAEIWKALDTTTHETIVVKTLRPELTDGDPAQQRYRAELLKRFRREGDLLERLDHPRIPQLLLRVGWSSEPYLVMDYVEGPSLDEFKARHHPMPFGAAVAIMVDLLDALASVHTQGVVHRDLKPSNAIVAMDGTTHLIDFGIAYLTDPDATRYTEFGSTPGSPGYKAPEIIAGTGEIAAAADLYSCGCIFFELLAGRPPFPYGDRLGLDYHHVNTEAPRVTESRPGTPREIDELITKMLEKEPGQRPLIVQALEVLRRHLPAEGSPAPELSLVPDPTAVYRVPSVSPTPTESQIGRRHRPVRRRAHRPDRQELASMVRAAAAEISGDGPEAAAKRLADVLRVARDAWGLLDPDVASAQLRCADASRLYGDWPAAGAFYREVERTCVHAETDEMQLLALEARFGVAECLIPEDKLQDARIMWADCAHELSALEAPPHHLVLRCQEIELELDERGYS